MWFQPSSKSFKKKQNFLYSFYLSPLSYLQLLCIIFLLYNSKSLPLWAVTRPSSIQLNQSNNIQNLNMYVEAVSVEIKVPNSLTKLPQLVRKTVLNTKATLSQTLRKQNQKYQKQAIFAFKNGQKKTKLLSSSLSSSSSSSSSTLRSSPL